MYIPSGGKRQPTSCVFSEYPDNFDQMFIHVILVRKENLKVASYFEKSLNLYKSVITQLRMNYIVTISPSVLYNTTLRSVFELPGNTP